MYTQDSCEFYVFYIKMAPKYDFVRGRYLLKMSKHKETDSQSLTEKVKEKS